MVSTECLDQTCRSLAARETNTFTLRTGNRGAPRTLEDATSACTINTADGGRTYQVLSLNYLFASKLRCWHHEREAGKDYRDLVWMCLSHWKKVQGFSASLDKNAKRSFAAQYATNEDDERRVNWLYKLLSVSESSSSSSSRASSSQSTDSRAPRIVRGP